MSDKKIVSFILGRVSLAMAVVYLLPIFYLLIESSNTESLMLFTSMMIMSLIVGMILTYEGRNHKKRIKINDSVHIIFFIWILMTILGIIPFIYLSEMSIVDAILETVSNLTSAGVSIIPLHSETVIKLWQASLMWIGSFVFLNMLVTLLPEVSGCFGMELSLNQGQVFSPMAGQMRIMARRISMTYVILTLLSVLMFKFAGVEIFQSIEYAMRCISTGGGELTATNRYVEYAAMMTMLIASGNFLLYNRLALTMIPALNSLTAKSLQKNISLNLKTFFKNSEVRFLNSAIMIMTLMIVVGIFDGNIRLTVFEIISYLSTTGINLTDMSEVEDYGKFILIISGVIGGCMGSVTGGLKAIRVIILFKMVKAEISKVIHPRLVTTIKVSGKAVPSKIIGRVLSYFFLSAVTLFICSVVLSLNGETFSKSVSITLACLTNLGNLPGLCSSNDFKMLHEVMKIFCSMIMVIGRVEIFAFLMWIGLERTNQKKRSW